MTTEEQKSFADSLDKAFEDAPEGEVFILISDTVARKLAEALRK